MQRSSENKNPKAPRPSHSSKNTGTEKKSADKSAAVSTDCCAFLSCSALYLVMRRETVRGSPEAATVASTANTDSATWYMPIPSEPRVRERMMRYKKPKNFSATEKAVTYAAVR